jgi:ectoine hydroxylase-related dioxygenase (phytanoyl-CoA dioxygenase family)
VVTEGSASTPLNPRRSMPGLEVVVQTWACGVGGDASAQQFFEKQGYLLLGGAVSHAQLAPVRDHVSRELKRIGARSRQLPKALSGLPPFQQIVKLSGLVHLPDLAKKVVSPTINAAVAALTQARVVSTQGQLLVSPPHQGDWRLDGLNWHTDISLTRREHSMAIQAFILLNDVEKCGGGTLILAGSHLARRDEAAEGPIRDALRRGAAGIADLARYHLSVVELVGKAGDVYLMDMRVLHTPSINSTQRFRMVATVRFFGA